MTLCTCWFSPLSPSLPDCLLPQLRSAGASVIQELFPRVSSIGTLDISDNGTVAHCNTSFCDLDHLSSGNQVLKGLLMDQGVLNSVCMCVDRSRCRLAHSPASLLQTPLPQTPSSRQELQHQKQVLLVLYVTLYCSYLCVCNSERVRAACACLNNCICDFTSVFISGCSWADSLLAAGNDLASSSSLISVFVSVVYICRVLDEVLQKLVQLIQEEECVSSNTEKRQKNLPFAGIGF